MDVQSLASRAHVTGSRATLKAIQNGQAQVVFIAADAEGHVADPLRLACAQRGVAIVEAASMRLLGQAARLTVPAAAAALIEDKR